jgi:hypothetical protein
MLPDRSMMLNTHPVVSLHRYFIWSAQMDTNFKLLLPRASQSAFFLDPDFIASVMYMSYAYATLYVVVEGWKDLKLSDPTVDKLLTSPNIELLRRFRNGAYHFQPEYFDERLTDFTAGGRQTMEWISSLQIAFKRYFDNWFSTHDFEGKLKNSPEPPGADET